jgi:hypothetical protein
MISRHAIVRSGVADRWLADFVNLKEVVAPPIEARRKMLPDESRSRATY